jgi:hypothetical protein
MSFGCNIAQAAIIGDGQTLFCKGISVADPISTIIVTGNSTSGSINIQKIDALVILIRAAIKGFTSIANEGSEMKYSCWPHITVQSLDGETQGVIDGDYVIGNGGRTSIIVRSPRHGCLNVSGGTRTEASQVNQTDSQLERLSTAHSMMPIGSFLHRPGIGSTNVEDSNSLIRLIAMSNRATPAISSRQRSDHRSDIGQGRSTQWKVYNPCSSDFKFEYECKNLFFLFFFFFFFFSFIFNAM